MAATKAMVCLFLVLVSLALVISQETSSHDPPTTASDGPQERLFFNLLPQLTSCNYTATPGRTCRSCRQTLTCLPRGVGFVRNCRGLFRYCNAGRCSLFPGSACFATTSTTTASTTTATGSTTTATGSTTTATGSTTTATGSTTTTEATTTTEDTGKR